MINCYFEQYIQYSSILEKINYRTQYHTLSLTKLIFDFDYGFI